MDSSVVNVVLKRIKKLLISWTDSSVVEHWTSNPKVVGSKPASSEVFQMKSLVDINQATTLPNLYNLQLEANHMLIIRFKLGGLI